MGFDSPEEAELQAVVVQWFFAPLTWLDPIA